MAKIERPAFITLVIRNGTVIRGRAVRYSDPHHADMYGAFEWEDSEGTTSYVMWTSIAHLTVFPLVSVDAPPPAAAFEG